MFQLFDKFAFVRSVNQHLQAALEKLVGHLLPFQRHHAILARHRGQFHHARHKVFYVQREGLEHKKYRFETANINRNRCGRQNGKGRAPEHDQNGRHIDERTKPTGQDHCPDYHAERTDIPNDCGQIHNALSACVITPLALQFPVPANLLAKLFRGAAVLNVRRCTAQGIPEGA